MAIAWQRFRKSDRVSDFLLVLCERFCEKLGMQKAFLSDEQWARRRWTNTVLPVGHSPMASIIIFSTMRGWIFHEGGLVQKGARADYDGDCDANFIHHRYWLWDLPQGPLRAANGPGGVLRLYRSLMPMATAFLPKNGDMKLGGVLDIFHNNRPLVNGRQKP
jgi:hypothetical protein